MLDQISIDLLIKENKTLRKENERYRNELKSLKEANVVLQARCTELERRLQLNSNNSSKPPSSDGLKKKPRNSSLRETGTLKPGGQKGHTGNTLKQVEKPDKVIPLPLDCCPDCATSLKHIAAKRHIRRQVFDIPLIQYTVEEYQSAVKDCPKCKKEAAAAFPEDVKAPVQYGLRVQALSIYLKHQQFLPEDRLKTLFKDIFRLPIGAATINKIGNTFSEKLSHHIIDIENYLRGSPVKHVDETGFRINGKTCWLHVLCNEQHTLYRISNKRGDVPKNLEGIVVHDHFKPYQSNMPNALHVYCNAHHLRELKALMELDNEVWAKQMWKLLLLGNRFKQNYDGKIPVKITERLVNLYDAYVASGLKYHESQPALHKKGSQGRIKRRPGHNLLLRFQKHKEATLRFLYRESVPFTNNQAERDIRMMKVKQKISGGFRTTKGANIFCQVRSFFSTLRKQGINILKATLGVIQGKVELNLVHST